MASKMSRNQKQEAGDMLGVAWGKGTDEDGGKPGSEGESRRQIILETDIDYYILFLHLGKLTD